MSGAAERGRYYKRRARGKRRFKLNRNEKSFGPDVLEFKDVAVTYDAGEKPAVSGISFLVGRGERVALLGLNGSGKTTLLAAAAGLVPHKGEIRVCGTPVNRGTLRDIRDRIGFLFNVPEDQLLFPKVLDDAAFGLQRRGASAKEAEEAARLMLDALGVGRLEQSPVHHLSHGQKQRVALAGALVTKPPLLLLDEPTAGLDPPGRRSLGKTLNELGAAVLVATHDAAFARSCCTRFVLIEKGRIVREGSTAGDLDGLWDG